MRKRPGSCRGAAFCAANWDLLFSLAPQAQKLLPGEKLAKIFDF